MSKRKIIIGRIIFTLIVGFIYYYFVLPPINITSLEFWVFIVILLVIFLCSSVANLLDTKTIIFNIKNKNLNINKYGIIPIAIISVFGLIFITNFILSPLFNSKSYSKRITIDESSKFTEDIQLVNFNSLPLLDKDSSSKLGDRVMGQMPELVSQFYVSELYTQINYNDDIVRVTPLEYAGFFKYLSNRKNGVKGYITVNSVSGESNLIKLDKGMKYIPSAIFGEDLHRHLRFNYPTLIFGNESFEIDNEGNPYWIIPIVKYKGINIRKDISGVIILNPITGKSKKYDLKDIPTWVDHVYSSELIIEQVNDWGKYKNGFFNSMIGQKNVVATTTGYNYTVMNDDVYLYTGITSTSSDESNLGFILSNLRTKETSFYKAPGAEEYSAMASAEGQVQQMKYTASFPLLINLNNKPTYLISLKDNAGLVKMYAFVDVEDYQKVVVSDASNGIEEAAKNYLGNGELSTNVKSTSKDIIISTIKNVTIDGNTYYYITDISGKKYKASIKIAKDKLPFINIGDTINISYNDDVEVISIKKIN